MEASVPSRVDDLAGIYIPRGADYMMLLSEEDSKVRIEDQHAHFPLFDLQGYVSKYPHHINLGPSLSSYLMIYKGTIMQVLLSSVSGMKCHFAFATHLDVVIEFIRIHAVCLGSED
jgi:hypothetical protein